MYIHVWSNVSYNRYNLHQTIYIVKLLLFNLERLLCFWDLHSLQKLLLALQNLIHIKILITTASVESQESVDYIFSKISVDVLCVANNSLYYCI